MPQLGFREGLLLAVVYRARIAAARLRARRAVARRRRAVITTRTVLVRPAVPHGPVVPADPMPLPHIDGDELAARCRLRHQLGEGL
ncbi:hypothetical protein P405_04140 [Streptomyces sp. FR-008]|nr:hypothetical protein P405_04140 [Streptomyces sp. FR-008]